MNRFIFAVADFTENRQCLFIEFDGFARIVQIGVAITKVTEINPFAIAVANLTADN